MKFLAVAGSTVFFSHLILFTFQHTLELMLFSFTGRLWICNKKLDTRLSCFGFKLFIELFRC